MKSNSAAAPSRPLLYVSIASIPQRVHLISRTVASLARQTHPPERVFAVLPYAFLRWPGLSPNVSLIPDHPLLEVLRCARDDGPGTKILCALPRIAELSRSRLLNERDRGRRVADEAAGPAAVVLADDDREYKASALSLLASCLMRAQNAYSFTAYELPGSADGPQRAPAIVGQGADLFAIPLHRLLPHNVRGFFELACSVDDRFRYHDDVWLSYFLQDVAGASVCRALGASNQIAPPQFLGPVHGPRETWATALRRLGSGNETRGLPRKALNSLLGAKRAELVARASALGYRTVTDADRQPCSTANSTPSAANSAAPGSASTTAAPERGREDEEGRDAEAPLLYYARRVGTGLGDAGPASWQQEACPFEETRHNCFFFNQSNAEHVANRARDLVLNVSTARAVQALLGSTLHFAGDSVLRQLAQATMCRLSRYLLTDGIAWWDPMKRRHPALDYKGMCPFANARHCEMRMGCATFGVERKAVAHPSAAPRRVLRICYDKVESLGWEGLANAAKRVTASINPARQQNDTRTYLIMSSGHHHAPHESLHKALASKWGDSGEASALAHRQAFKDAMVRGAPHLRPIFQEAEPQHFPGGGGFNPKASSTTGLRQCEPLPEGVGAVAELERRLVRPHLDAIGGAFLETGDISRAAWWAHTVAAPTPSGASDCTHWCMPGIPDVWASKLLLLLAR